MDARETMSALISELWPDGIQSVTGEEVFARVREMNRQRGETTSILDAAGIDRGVELPGRVARLSAAWSRCLTQCADAQNKTGDLLGQLEAARGDLRVERERAEMLDAQNRECRRQLEEANAVIDVAGLARANERIAELYKNLAGQQSNVDEAQRRALAYKAERDEAYRMLGRERTTHRAVVAERDTLKAANDMVARDGLVQSLAEVANIPPGRHIVCAIKELREERDTLAARVKELEGVMGSSLVVSGLNLREDFDAARSVMVDFAFDAPRRDMTLILKHYGTTPATKPLSKPDPDVREMPFEAPGDEVKSEKWLDDIAALNMWRGRAVKCQKTLRNIRVMTGDWNFCIDEDWGADN